MAETNQRVRLGFGKVNLKTQLATIASLRLRPRFIKDSAITSGKRDPKTLIYNPVSAHPEINGSMQSDMVTHPNGTILLIQSQWRRGGSPIRDGAILLRLRQEAALINVVAKLPHGPDSILGDTYSVFQGNADILSPDEAMSLHRIALPGRYIDQFFDPEQIDECYEITELVPERVSKPVVTMVATSQGVVTTEVAAAPSRRMRFRK